MSEPTGKVSSAEVVELLLRIARGEVVPTLAEDGDTWEEAFAGNMEFLCDGWRLTVFNDCDEFDYVDAVVAPDGRRGEYDDWRESDEVGFTEACEVPVQALYRVDEGARELAEEAFRKAVFVEPVP